VMHCRLLAPQRKLRANAPQPSRSSKWSDGLTAVTQICVHAFTLVRAPSLYYAQHAGARLALVVQTGDGATRKDRRT